MRLEVRFPTRAAVSVNEEKRREQLDAYMREVVKKIPEASLGYLYDFIEFEKNMDASDIVGDQVTERTSASQNSVGRRRLSVTMEEAAAKRKSSHGKAIAQLGIAVSVALGRATALMFLCHPHSSALERVVDECKLQTGQWQWQWQRKRNLIRNLKLKHKQQQQQNKDEKEQK